MGFGERVRSFIDSRFTWSIEEACRHEEAMNRIQQHNDARAHREYLEYKKSQRKNPLDDPKKL